MRRMIVPFSTRRLENSAMLVENSKRRADVTPKHSAKLVA